MCTQQDVTNKQNKASSEIISGDLLIRQVVGGVTCAVHAIVFLSVRKMESSAFQWACDSHQAVLWKQVEDHRVLSLRSLQCN